VTSRVARGRSAVAAAASRPARISTAAWIETGVVLAGFGVIAVLLTWPLADHMGSWITTPEVAGDPSGYVWDLWYAAHHGVTWWGSYVQGTVGAPFGRHLPGSASATILVTLLPGWVIARIWSPIAAYDVNVLAALALSSAAMYALLRWLGLGRGVATWGGVVYMLFPYHLAKADAHLPFAHLECFPLLLLAALWWLERATWRRAVVLALAVGLCWVTTPYYGLMGTIMGAVALVVGLWRLTSTEGFRQAIQRVAIAAGISVLIVGIPLAAVFLSGRGAAAESFSRNRVELQLYGASAKDYVWPSFDSTLLQGIDSNWASRASPGGERVDFLGWLTLGLAVVACVLAIVAWRRFPSRQRAAFALAAPLVPVLAWFSLADPTVWFGVRIPTPSGWLFDLLPYLRAYARFVASVMAAIVVVAAIGLGGLLRGRSQLARNSILAAALVVSAVELPTAIPVPTGVPMAIAGRAPESVATWRWLRDHPGNQIVYEAPAWPSEALNRFFMWGQMVHGHPIANGTLITHNLSFDYLQTVGDPRIPRAAETLASVGIRLVAVEPWAYNMLGIPPPDSRHPPHGFRLVRAFGDGSAIWRVTARPADAVAIPRGEGWWDPQTHDGALWRWMKDDARVTLDARSAGTYRISFPAHGLLRGRRYRLSLEAPGRPPVALSVGTAVRPVTAKLRLRKGLQDVHLRDLGPAPRQINAQDPRIVSVETAGWTLTRSG
jgi:hypothetical protein